MALNIRDVLPQDREFIVSIIKRTANFTAEEIDCAVELLDIYLNNPVQKDYNFLCAVDSNNKPIGYVCCGRVPLTDGTYDLYWIVIDPLHCGVGIGKRLVNYVADMLKEQSGRMLLAETSSKPNYYGTRTFYERRGFLETARIKDFYKIGDDKIIYCMNLNHEHD